MSDGFNQQALERRIDVLEDDVRRLRSRLHVVETVGLLAAGGLLAKVFVPDGALESAFAWVWALF